jgi:hypothetical protein
VKTPFLFLVICCACQAPEALPVLRPESQDSDTIATETVHRSGRFTSDDRFAWSGTSVSATFQGTSIAVTLGGGPASFVATIDGVKKTPFTITGSAASYTLATGLGAGLHTVVLQRRSEAQWGVTTFGGFTVIGGSLVASATPSFTHRLLVMGDSITCGYGVAGVNGTCHFDTTTEDATVAYPFVMAELLDADVQVVAWQGKGIYQAYTGSTDDQIPDLFERTLPDDPASVWNHAAYVPDIIIINLGTNDQSYNDAGVAFENAYLLFLAHLRTLFPSAEIYLGQGPMGSLAFQATHLQNVVNRTGDSRIHKLTISDIDPTDGFGCDGHPNAVTHQKMAEQILGQLE